MSTLSLRAGHDISCNHLDFTGADDTYAELAADVAEILPVLPILNAHLADTVREVEMAVVGVCDSFQAIVGRARDLVSDDPAADTADRSATKGMSELIHTARETMETLLRRIEGSCRHSTETVAEMQVLQEGMKQIEKRLRNVDELAKNARLVALNGRIEAARAGDRGTAFAIVAAETAVLAKHAAETSDAIREIVAQLAAATHSAAKGIESRADEDLRSAERSREEVDGVLRFLAEKNRVAEATLAQTAEASRALANDISRAVMAMQFQDAMSQRIGHVIHTLDKMYAELRCKVEVPEEDAVEGNKWLDDLASRYVMAAQRQTHGIDAATSSDESEDSDDIELF